MNGKHPILESFVRGRFSLLLCTMALMFFAVPLIPGDRAFLGKVVDVFGLAVFIACLRAISASRRFFIFMVVLSVINVGIGSSEIVHHSDEQAFVAVVLGFRLVYYLLVFLSIMKYVFDSSPVTGDKICGAISAYLLMGIIWAVVYSMFFRLLPASFILPEEWVSRSLVGIWAYYFSFTTLTTLGYGDVTPQLPVVQSYAVMEAACGQVFLAVIIARLVALQIIHSSDRQ